MGNFAKMPHVQAVTNHTEESAKIKVIGVLETFSLAILSLVKFIHSCIFWGFRPKKGEQFSWTKFEFF
jgi:hypothetical protein